jgi:histidyl-tRNA synthetase
LEGKVGSISGGGRYDGLIGMFSSKAIPAIGVSLGLERIFTILEEKALQD